MKKSLLLVLVLSVFLASGVGAATTSLMAPSGTPTSLAWLKEAVGDSSYVSLAAATKGSTALLAGTADTLAWIDLKMYPAPLASLTDSTQILLLGVLQTSMTSADTIRCTWQFSMNEDKSQVITCSLWDIPAQTRAITVMRGNGGALYYPIWGARWARVILQAFDSSLTAITGVRLWVPKMKGI